jgi:hypothetical protein
LQQICAHAKVDPKTGDVSLTTVSVGYGSGCDCLKALISGKRKVKIQLLDCPTRGFPPDHREIGSCLGGATTWTSPSSVVQPNGNPGRDSRGKVGGDATVYIDRSNNHGRGYNVPGQPNLPCPLWLILAHELTSGHAYHVTRGTSAATQDEAENQAISSENEHRAEHGEAFGQRTLR